MTTRLAKVSTRGPKKVYVQVHCPACRQPTRCLSVGVGTVDGVRREIVRCTAKDCEIEFLPRRRRTAAAA